MELRITERFRDGQWTVSPFKDLVVGDIVRVDDIPDKMWRVAEAPHEVINEKNEVTMSFLADPYTLP